MPKDHNKLDNKELEEISDEDFRNFYLESLESVQEDKIVKGKIVRLSDSDVLVDIGYKSEGSIPISEFRDAGEIKVGDDVEVYLEQKEDMDGMVVLSKIKADKIVGWEKVIASCEEGKIVDGRIIKKVKGGLIVDIGMEAFLPASQIDIRPLRDVLIESYVGKTFQFKVIKINQDRKNIVLSRRELLEEDRKEKRKVLLEEIEPGQMRKGTVKNITDFGAFIDLNGIDGLLHITDMSWGKVGHPSELVSMGDEVEVMVLDFDRERERVSLGLKQKTPDPWDKIGEKYPSKSKVKGRVVNIMPYGAFVELEKGIEGLIHISELSWTRRINHPSELLSVGDIVETMILDIDKGSRKLSLGLKQTGDDPWTAVGDKYEEGMKVKGTVRNLTSYGAFIELDEGIDGLVHVSDISWTRKIGHPSEVMKKGDEVEAIVINMDVENKKIALGIKQLQEDPWERIEEKYRSGDVLKAKVSKITGFGVFMELEEGVEGLVHVSQISKRTFNKIEDVVKEDEIRDTMVLKVDKEARKIALSLKDVEEVAAEKPEKESESEAPAGKVNKKAKEEAKAEEKAEDEEAPVEAAAEEPVEEVVEEEKAEAEAPVEAATEEPVEEEVPDETASKVAEEPVKEVEEKAEKTSKKSTKKAEKGAGEEAAAEKPEEESVEEPESSEQAAEEPTEEESAEDTSDKKSK